MELALTCGTSKNINEASLSKEYSQVSQQPSFTLMMVILVLSTHFTYVCFLDGACYLCSLDWIAFGNNFYHSFREIKTWADSQSSCEEWNSHLVEIGSKAELVGHTLLLSCFFVTVCSESTGHEDLAN